MFGARAEPGRDCTPVRRAPGCPPTAIGSPACRPPSPKSPRSPRRRPSSGPPSRSARERCRGGRRPRPRSPRRSTPRLRRRPSSAGCERASPRAPTRLARRSAGCARPRRGARRRDVHAARRSSSRWSGGRGRGRRPRGWSTRVRARAGSLSPPGGASPRRASSASRSTRSRPLPAARHLAAAGLAGRVAVEVADYRWRAPRPPDRRPDALPRQPALRPPPPDRRGLEGVARADGAGPRPGGQPAGRAARPLLPRDGGARAAGDRGAFITAAEWLDVNYGAPRARAPAGRARRRGASTSSSRPRRPSTTPRPPRPSPASGPAAEPRSIRVRRVATSRRLGRSRAASPCRAERLREARRWSPLTRAARAVPEGYVELGELVSRAPRRRSPAEPDVGRAAGRDRPAGRGALPVRHARAGALRCGPALLGRPRHLRRVIDLPADLDVSRRTSAALIERFLAGRGGDGAHEGYIARRAATRGGRWACGRRRRSSPPTWRAGRRRSSATWPARATSTSRTASTRASRFPTRRSTRLAASPARERERARWPHLRGRAHQVRAARDGAAPDPGPPEETA